MPRFQIRPWPEVAEAGEVEAPGAQKTQKTQASEEEVVAPPKRTLAWTAVAAVAAPSC